MRIMPRPEWLEKRNEVLLENLRSLEVRNNELERRIETMRGVLLFTFMMSAIALLLIIEKLLSPFLRTL